MWICPKCQRVFKKINQPHSCKAVPLEKHFENKEKAKKLFDFLVGEISVKIGEVKIISIPCCIHLFGNYDFLAILPKKDGLELRFALDEKLDHPKIFKTVPMSLKIFKNCLYIKSESEVNDTLIKWLTKSYHLKD